ncbi:MAG: PASTA domain-containing protein [Desulforhopalus sp.]
MIRKPRLRVQKERRGRRLILYLLILAVLAAAGYQVEQQIRVSQHVKEVYASLKKSFSGDNPARGTIYDRNLKQLATTLDRVAVYVRTREIRSIEQTAVALAKVFELDGKTLQHKLESGVLRVWVKKDISQEQEESAKNLDLPGVYFQREEKRYYPHDSQAAHLIGYVEDGIGLSGVEFYYDRLLASRKIKQREDQEPLSSAQDLVLTLDLKIQSILELLVAEIQKNENALRVAAYLIESRTGEIVGGAQVPGFDPNVFTRYPQTILDKIFLDSFYLPWKYRKFLHDAAMLLERSGNGSTVLPWSIVEADNDLGSQIRLWDRLGLSDEEPVDFQAPSQGNRSTQEQQAPLYSPLESAVSTLVPQKTTPLKLLAAYAALLYGGEKIRPFIVEKILDPETGAEVMVSENGNGEGGATDSPSRGSTEVGRLFRSQTAEGPMASRFFRDEIVITAGVGSATRFLLNDVTYVTIPAGGETLNMLVVLQRYPQGVSGNNGAEKTLEDLIGEKVARLSILQQVSKTVADVVEPESVGGGNYQEEERASIELHTIKEDLDPKKKIPEIMPDLKGLSLRKSLRLLQGIDLKINIEGTGRVVEQRPSPGKALQDVAECSLILEKSENMYPEMLFRDQDEER